MTNIGNILGDIFERLNKTTVSFIAIFTLMGMGFTAGKYYQDVFSKAEIMELNNKHSRELMDMRTKQTLEIIELQKNISLLEVKNEKGKK